MKWIITILLCVIASMGFTIRDLQPIKYVYFTSGIYGYRVLSESDFMVAPTDDGWVIVFENINGQTTVPCIDTSEELAEDWKNSILECFK